MRNKNILKDTLNQSNSDCKKYNISTINSPKKETNNAFYNIQTQLTEKQVLFCQAYSETQNATSSALTAGYSEKNAANTGCMLLRNRFVRERISKIMQVKLKVAEITDDYLKLKLKIIIDKAVDASGNIDTALVGQAISAIKMLGATKNMFNEKTTKDINFKIEIIDRYEEKSKPVKAAQVLKQLPEVSKEVKNTLKDIVIEEGTD